MEMINKGKMNQSIDILLVEDNPSDAKLTLKALLRNNNHIIHHVNDGEEALNYIFGEGEYLGRNIQNTPKCILLDLKLPKVDGLEVLRKMKSDERTRFIPIVILTSSNQESDLVESYRLGANSYLVKPVTYSDYIENISFAGEYWLSLNMPIN